MIAMTPDRLAVVDRIQANEATRDLLGELDALRAEAVDDGWWERFVHIWECSVLGRDVQDTSPLTPDELVLLRLELI